MHGRLKTRTTEEQKELKRIERQKKVVAYKTAIDILCHKRKSGVYDNESLDIITTMVLANPDITTLWNYRREIFLQLKKEESEEAFQNLLSKDLQLTEQCLRVNPKSYSSWHHRVWVLETMPKPDWEKEIALCTKYLELDERNFHCWDYRRVVARKAGVPAEKEYEYTLKKIEANFSNYSAWHLRSKLFPRIYLDDEDGEMHKEELRLVRNAAFTDPYDQSAWFYQRWLLGLGEPPVSIVAVQATKQELTVALSKPIKQLDTQGACLEVSANGVPVNGLWQNIGNNISSTLWTFTFFDVINEDTILSLKLLAVDTSSSINIKCGEIKTGTIKFIPEFSSVMREALEEELTECLLLCEMEPDSKWALLASTLFMQAINTVHYKKDIMATLDQLLKVDPLRVGYYADLRSKLTIEHSLLVTPPGISTSFALSNSHLTCFYHSQYLFLFECVDLSSNQLRPESLACFGGLLSCKVLNLAGNILTTLCYLPVLPKLEKIILDNNELKSCESFKVLAETRSLCEVSLKNNPISGTDELRDFAVLVKRDKSSGLIIHYKANM